MHKFFVIVSLVILIFGLNSCRSVASEAPAQPSAFFAGFSLAEVISANEGHLLPGHRVSGAQESTPSESLFQKREEASVQLDPDEITPFLEGVKATFEGSLTQNDAQIIGQGNSSQGEQGQPVDIAYFSLSYRQGQIVGVINVWGVRQGETGFALIVLLTESA